MQNLYKIDLELFHLNWYSKESIADWKNQKLSNFKLVRFAYPLGLRKMASIDSKSQFFFYLGPICFYA